VQRLLVMFASAATKTRSSRVQRNEVEGSRQESLKLTLQDPSTSLRMTVFACLAAALTRSSKTARSG